MKINGLALSLGFVAAFVPFVAFAQSDTTSTVPTELTAITQTAPVTTTAEVTQTASITETVQAAEAAYDGCDEIVIDGPIWAWHGEIVTFTLTINWEGKKDKYTLYDGGQNLLDTFDPWERIKDKKIRVVKQMDTNVHEFADELFILVQGPLTHPWCEENHIVTLMSPAMIYLPIISSFAND